MNSKFKAGDKVALKTGSPVMTIKNNAFSQTPQGIVSIFNKYECVWNDGIKQQTAVFIEDVLKLVSAR
jgi:uncharacterized protein YodC (DUF2158 family)